MKDPAEVDTDEMLQIVSNSPNTELCPKEVERLIGNTEIEVPEADTTIPLSDLMTDVMSGHYELSAYQRGALTYCAALKEEIALAEERGDTEYVALLKVVFRSTFGLYLRVKRGDDELFEEDDGEYSDFFNFGPEEVTDMEPDDREMILKGTKSSETESKINN